MPHSPAHLLLVEGKSDQHVVWALCDQRRLPEVFFVETPKQEGIASLLTNLPTRLKNERLRTLGVVLDADQDLPARWQAVRHRLNASGYAELPDSPPAEGWISAAPSLPRVGVWLMPDNRLPGMLEDFVAQLIPPGDELRPKAEAILQEIEQAGLNRYATVHHPKALIHTWLAWQEPPGMPLGQAITAQALRHDSPIALSFVARLRRLFELPAVLQ